MAEETRICSPTGNAQIRQTDSFGSGYFRAPRGGRLHAGVDFSVDAGADVFAPISGKIVRRSYPYAHDLRFQGLIIEGEGVFTGFSVTLWYVKPIEVKIGKIVKKGERVGIAQDLSIKYLGIINHVHMNLLRNGIETDSSALLESSAQCQPEVQP
ncbi:MAG: M23 family metallopeptidase [Limnobacter sp.]|nr:M23 family metallopeptidase [Limnobacter sp.]